MYFLITVQGARNKQVKQVLIHPQNTTFVAAARSAVRILLPSLLWTARTSVSGQSAWPTGRGTLFRTVSGALRTASVPAGPTSSCAWARAAPNRPSTRPGRPNTRHGFPCPGRSSLRWQWRWISLKNTANETFGFFLCHQRRVEGFLFITRVRCEKCQIWEDGSSAVEKVGLKLGLSRDLNQPSWLQNWPHGALQAKK